MVKRAFAFAAGLALSCALSVPALAQTVSDPPNMTQDVQPVPVIDRSNIDNQDVDRTEMEIQSTQPTATPGQVAVDPSAVLNATPFSLEANYMSIPGAFRYLTYDQSGTWLARDEAVAQVQSENQSATR